MSRTVEPCSAPRYGRSRDALPLTQVRGGPDRSCRKKILDTISAGYGYNIPQKIRKSKYVPIGIPRVSGALESTSESRPNLP